MLEKYKDYTPESILLKSIEEEISKLKQYLKETNICKECKRPLKDEKQVNDFVDSNIARIKDSYADRLSISRSIGKIPESEENLNSWEIIRNF